MDFTLYLPLYTDFLKSSISLGTFRIEINLDPESGKSALYTEPHVQPSATCKYYHPNFVEEEEVQTQS